MNMAPVPVGERRTMTLNAGETLTLTTDAQSSGVLFRMPDSGGGPGSGHYGSISNQAISASGSLLVGPFNRLRKYLIETKFGSITYSADVLEGRAVSSAEVV